MSLVKPTTKPDDRAVRDSARPGMSRSLVILFAISCGLVVGNIYYAQPLLDTLAHVFQVSQTLSGLIITMTQIGYAIGLLFIVPLGDLLENRRLIILVLFGTVTSLLIAGAAPSISVFFIASLLIGTTSVVAQILIPFSAELSRPEERGQVVGQIVSGLLLGILFARAVSGFVAGLFGWRTVYFSSAIALLILIAVLVRSLPTRKPGFSGNYGQLLASLYHIFMAEPILRRRAAYQSAMFASFTGFWTTITFRLASPEYHFSEIQIGLFALAGAAGALIAPLAGRLGDRGHQRLATGVAFLVALAGYLITLVHGQIWMLIAAAVLLDMAVQTTLVLGQQMIYTLKPEERSRLNTLYIATFFVGGAVGSAVASREYEHVGWEAVVATGTVLSFLALVYWLTEPRKKAA